MENKYEKMTEEEFIKETSGFKSTSELHFFVLLNILNLILHNGYHYCLCEKYQGPTLRMQEFLFILQDTDDF